MQSLNIDAARKLGQEEQANAESRAAAAAAGGAGAGATSLETPAPQMADTGTPYSLNTPDILNSLISITTNPFFDNIPMTTEASAEGAGTTSTTTNSTAGGATSNGNSATGSSGNDQESGGGGAGTPQEQTAPSAFGGEEDRKVFATLEAPTAGPSPSISSMAPSAASASAPAPPPTSTVTSVQSMTSQLIKDSLKHTIQSKRKNSGKEDLDIKAELQAAKVRRKEEVGTGTGIGKRTGAATSAAAASSEAKAGDTATGTTTTTKLTPEDEERRRRRRERNKVAATKCRNKKKEKTGLLAIESETLEGSNISLKSEISQLEHERQQLLEVLAAHNSVCTKVHKPNARLPQLHTHVHAAHALPHSQPTPAQLQHHSPPMPMASGSSFYSQHLPHSHNGYHHPSIHPHLYGVGVGVSVGGAHAHGHGHMMHPHHHAVHAMHHTQQSTIQL